MAKDRKMKFDFTGVESFNKPAEGSHKVKIKKVEETSSQGGNDMLKITFEVISGPSKGCRVIENYPIVDTALWKLKSLLQAIGMKAEGKVQIDLDKMEGKTLEIEVFYEEYNGQDRAKISETRKLTSKVPDDEDEDDSDEDEADEVEDDEDEEEEEEPEEKPKKKAKPAKKPEKKPAKKKAEPEDDDDWDDDDEDDDWE